MTKLNGRVWHVSSDKDDTVLIGMDVEYDERYVRWFDSVKERIMGIEKVEDPRSEHFVFHRRADEGGQTYTFEPMTLALYNQWVKHRLLIPRDMTDEDAMLKGLESSRTNAW